MPRKSKPLETRLQEHIIKEDCWIWTGSKARGYGYLSITINSIRQNIYAHRLAWELYRGPIPEGLVVRHRCPQKRKDCCNPDHLLLGTQKENMADMVIDDTILIGERNPKSILTEEQVKQFKVGYPNTKGLNTEYVTRQSEILGVSISTLWNIVYGNKWKHITT